MDKILILDFGSQTTQLIARRIRGIGVYSEIIPGDARLDGEVLDGVKGIILSGSPYSVYEHGAPRPDRDVYTLGLPLLGICYGLHTIIHDHGGGVALREHREYGRAKVRFTQRLDLFENVPEGFSSWMSHGDAVDGLPETFAVAAVSENGLPAGVVDRERQFYGIQFHPEVTHCEYGNAILANFALRICGACADWNMDTFLNQARTELKRTVGARGVLLLISGGVDSSVVGALLLRSLSADQVYLMYIDTGLMRRGETQEVLVSLEELGAKNLFAVDASGRFYSSLAGVTDPEEKRRIIGDLFIRVQEEEVTRLGIQADFLAQGTLYTDLIESGRGVGNRAHLIKSHHNVVTPLVQAKRESDLLLEPLSMLYKDEVRELGIKLGVDERVINRHPFPGPGLAVRILGEVTPERCDILRSVDSIYIDELKRRGLYRKIWQAFSVLLPIRSVGVTGDSRRYGYVVALRAVTSSDGMTADVYSFDAPELQEISARITNSIPEVGRVVYDVSSKPPSTIEWE